MGLVTGGTVRNAVPVEVSFSGEYRSRNTAIVALLELQLAEALDKARAKYQEAVIHQELEMLFQMYTLDPNEPVVRMVTDMLKTMKLAPNIKPSAPRPICSGGTFETISCRAPRMMITS